MERAELIKKRKQKKKNKNVKIYSRVCHWDFVWVADSGLVDFKDIKFHRRIKI